jgi:predicted dehydrogenase
MSTYRIVVAGCGGMANAWLDYALKRDDAEIVGLVDIKLEFAKAKAEKYGLDCGVYTDLKEAIEQNNANLVFDVTIPDSHFSIASTAMRSGCDVLSEKPLAATLEQCRELIRISEETGRTHTIMQNRRYDKRIRALQEMVGGGVIGKAGYCGADFFIGAHFGGFRDLMDNVLLVDMAIHTFDQARLILGADPVSVYCHEFNPAGSWYQGNSSAICIFEMTDGSVFCYRGSWSAEGASTSWEASWRVNGEKGTAIWDGHGMPYAEVLAAEQKEGHVFMKETVRVEAPELAIGNEMHTGCFDEMFAALQEGRRAETDSRDNIHSMAMVFGAVESARTGKKVVIADL